MSPRPVIIGVNGSWAVPSVSVSQKDTFSAVWIGIGGYTDETLIQIGTEQDSVNGSLIYSAWYELLPNDSVAVDTINITPGDKIIASINLVDSATNAWSIELNDVTKGQGFKRNFLYDSSRLSAEWIVERPTINDTLSALADFGSITLTDSTLTMSSNVGPISDFPFAQVIMHDRQNRELVIISPLDPSGSSFTVNYSSGFASTQSQSANIEVLTNSMNEDGRRKLRLE